MQIREQLFIRTRWQREAKSRNIFSNFFDHGLLSEGKKIDVEIIDNQDNFSDYEWKELYKLSENTFVEETESLKQGGAGAGLTDND